MLGDTNYTEEQKQAIPPAVWPLVDTHPGSGRKVLFVGVHARRILGWPVAEGRMFLADLLEHDPGTRLGADPLPGINPGQAKNWGLDSFQVWPF